MERKETESVVMTLTILDCINIQGGVSAIHIADNCGYDRAEVTRRLDSMVRLGWAMVKEFDGRRYYRRRKR